MSDRRAYGSIRSLVERLGGSMAWAKRGYRHGAWIITIRDKRLVIPASGKQSFPQLDGLLVPLTSSPRTWNDYSNDLLPDAETRLLAMLRDSPAPEALPPDSNTPKADPVRSATRQSKGMRAGVHGTSKARLVACAGIPVFFAICCIAVMSHFMPRRENPAPQRVVTKQPIAKDVGTLQRDTSTDTSTQLRLFCC